MKAHLRLWRLRRRRGRIEQGHDAMEDTDYCSLMRIEPGSKFFLQCGEFLGEFASIGEGGAHLHEGTYHENTHLHGLRALEDSGGHDGAVLGECEGQVFHMMAVP